MTEAPDPADGDLRRLSPLTPFARSGVFFVVAAYAGGREVLQEGRLAGLAIAVGVVLLAGLAFGFVAWYRTSFRISATELRVDTGVLRRRSRRVRLDRILEIAVEQPFVARVLGLAELKIETATRESEVSLAYLPLAEAHRVRQTLLDHRAQWMDDDEDGAPAAPETGALVLDVPVRWQVLGLVLSPETVGLLVMAGAAALMLGLGVPLAAFGIGFATFLGAAVSLARKVVGWWGWRVTAVRTGWQVRHGLFSVSTRTFNVARLQGVRISEPILQRPAGLARLDLSVAGGAAHDGDHDDRGVAVPVAPREVVVRLAGDLVGADPDTVAHTTAPTRARWLRPLGQPFLRFGMDDRVVVARTGWATRRTDIVPLTRVQSFRLTQGPLQRRLRLATVHADTPAGLVKVAGRHRDPAEARRVVVDGSALARTTHAAPTAG